MINCFALTSLLADAKIQKFESENVARSFCRKRAGNSILPEQKMLSEAGGDKSFAQCCKLCVARCLSALSHYFSPQR